jgi:hypothetical protein
MESDENTILEENPEDYLKQLEQENQAQQSQINHLTSVASSSGLFGQKDSNIVSMEIDTDDILERVEHFLRGDLAERSGDNVVWRTPENSPYALLNEAGINQVMQILHGYVSRVHSLSYYENIERIYEILADLGEELSCVIYCNYEKMGMDTPYKKSKYKLIVLYILHSIESNYRKALRGNQLREINSARIIFPQENMGGMSSGMNAQRKKGIWERFGLG